MVEGTAAAFVAAKLAERDERHARAGASRYLVEPNVKEGKGGLRDLNTLYWIAQYLHPPAILRDADQLRLDAFTGVELKRLPARVGFPVGSASATCTGPWAAPTSG